jgi:hypothetical protein
MPELSSVDAAVLAQIAEQYDHIPEERFHKLLSELSDEAREIAHAVRDNTHSDDGVRRTAQALRRWADVNRADAKSLTRRRLGDR